MKKYILILTVLSATLIEAKAQSVTKSTLKLQGIEMKESMNEDGTALVKRPYRWFAGIGTADDKGVAVEMAQLEAYATVSRVIENVVKSNAERGALSDNGKVQKVIQSYWEQKSQSIQKACEPFGETEVTYNSDTGMYEAIAKVGIRGDRYVKLFDEAKNAKPEGLNSEEAKEFIEINENIINAVKGN